MGRERSATLRAAIPAGVIACVASGPALSQTPPIQRLPSASQSLREATRTPSPEARPLGPEPDIRFTSQAPPANAREIFLTLRGVELAGGTLYADEELRPEYADMLGQTVSVADIFALAARIQDRYRSDGYLFTRVIVPAQEISGGVVRLELIEAWIEVAEIEEPGAPLGPMRDLAESYVRHLQGLRNPTHGQIERVLLLINDIPGVFRAAAVPKLGEGGRGAVRLYINVERDPDDLSLFLDNRQSPVVGSWMIGGVASANSYTSYGDTTSLFAFNSAGFDSPFPEDFEERWTLQLEHAHFIGSDGLALRGRALYSESHPGDVLEPLGIESRQAELELDLRWPAIRTRALTLDVWGGVEASELDTYLPGSGTGAQRRGFKTADDSLRMITAGVQGLQRDRLGYTAGQLEARQGLPILGATSDGDTGRSRPDADGVFFLIRGELERTFQIWGPVTLWGRVMGQWSSEPLLASEEFAIGGPEIGRAYDPSEYVGDWGVGAVGELRWLTDFVVDALRVESEFYVYGDWGEVRNIGDAKPKHASLSSAGFGVRTRFPGDLAVGLEAAKPVAPELQRTQDEDWRFFVTASKRF